MATKVDPSKPITRTEATRRFNLVAKRLTKEGLYAAPEVTIPVAATAVKTRAAWLAPSGALLYGYLYHDCVAARARFRRNRRMKGWRNLDSESQAIVAGWVRVQMSGFDHHYFGVVFRTLTEQQKDAISLLATVARKAFRWEKMDIHGETIKSGTDTVEEFC